MSLTVITADQMQRMPRDVTVKRVFHDAYGFLWVQTSRGPIRWDADGGRWDRFDLNEMAWAGSVH